MKENQIKALQNRLKKKKDMEKRNTKQILNKKQEFYRSIIVQINESNKNFLDSVSQSKKSIIKTKITTKPSKSLKKNHEDKRGSLKLQIMQVDENDHISPIDTCKSST